MTEEQPNIPDPTCLSGTALEQKAEAIAAGKASNETARVVALSVLAGMFIASGALLMTVVKSDATLSFAAASVLGGVCFALGLITVIVAGAELFTGNNLMVMAALSGTIGWKAVAKNWVVVWLGNLAGSLLVVALAFFANTGALNSGAVWTTMMSVAVSKINLDWWVILLRGIGCNFLVCLAVWMGFAGKSVVDKIFTTIFPVMAFVALGFEHCVANMFFLPMGLAAKAFSGVDASGIANIDVLNLGGIAYNICFATLGNIVGGAVLVGLLYWIAYRKKKSA
ncbi:MAG: formate/nitrite transporter family protein [Coriobacteriia bacterium]|nr:formate/nitrite transporter family protein [Coriobacteriia bacterium]